MKISRVSRKYARALFEVLKGSDKLRGALTELESVSAVLSKDQPELRLLLGHPRIRAEHKADLVKKVFGNAVSAESLQLLQLLARRNRFSALPGIVSVLDAMVLDAEGKARAVVTSAVPLDDKQKQELLHKIGTMTGRFIDLTLKTDPSLIGGLVIQVGDRLINGSVKFQLEKLHENLKSVRIG